MNSEIIPVFSGGVGRSGTTIALFLENLVLEDRENCYRKLVSHIGLSDERAMRRYFDSEVTAERAHFGRWKRDFKDPEAFRTRFETLIAQESK